MAFIRYADLNRLDAAIELITAARPRVVIDYGAGDGELIAQLLRDDRAASVELAISYEPIPSKLALALERFGDDPRAAGAGSFEEIDAKLDGRAADAISCSAPSSTSRSSSAGGSTRSARRGCRRRAAW